MHTKRVLLITASTLVATTALAQEPQGAFDLGEIRIEAPGAQSLLGNTELTPEEIEDRNATSMSALFNGKTQITGSGGAAIAQKVFVQGIEESLLSVTIDGARQNKSAFHHSGNVLMDPAMLKRVEISAGLAPADAGPGGLGGSIAYETKDARDFLEPGDNFGGYLSVGGSNNVDELRGTLALYGRSGGFEYLLAGTRHTGEDYEDGDGNNVDGTGAEISDYLGKFALNMDDGGRLEFSASQTEDDGDRAGQAGPFGLFFARPDFGGIVSGGNDFLDVFSKRTSYTLTYTDETPDGWFDPTFQLTWNEQETDVSGVAGTNTSLSGTFKNRFDIGNGSITAGLDFFNDSAEGQTNADAPFNFSGKETLQNIGLFAQARQDLSDRVSVSYGARVDFQEFEGADGSEFESSGVSGNGSIDVVLTDTLSFNAGIASTWGGYELGEAALINFAGDWSYEGFEPSRSLAKRVGLRYHSGPWEVRAAYFQTDISNVAAVLPVDAESRGKTYDIETSGWDASLGYTGVDGYARLNYTYADVKADEEAIATTAYYLGRPVGHLIGLEGAWDVNDQIRLGGTAEFALENDDVVIDGEQEALPAYEVVNLFGEYRPEQMQNLSVRLDVENLFDQTYSRRSSDGVGYYRVIPLNEPGRTVRLTAKILF